MKKTLLAALALAPMCAAAAAPLWLRDAAISPDGTQIAFQYKGDIWCVPTAGGSAVRLTSTPSYESNPVWSPDGKTLAFASDRSGNFDVYVMPAAGGVATRLTFNSAKEIPEAFTTDGKKVLFSAPIQDPASSAAFPAASLSELYEVPVKGGQSIQALANTAQLVSFLPDGRMLYQDHKGMENEWRKHHTSSVARDIWVYDPATGKHTKLTGEHAGEDRNPVAAGADEFYFLSERDGGSMNVYKASLSAPNSVAPVTSFKKHPVRFLSRSNQGTLCFTYDGEIYTMAPGGRPSKVDIDILLDEEDAPYKMSIPRPTDMAVSPDGKQIAFISRGDVFVTSVDYKTTKQITSTPQAERHIAWGHDSKTLLYVSERDGRPNIYRAVMVREDEPNFPNATLVKEEALFSDNKHDRTVPQMSPDGKMLAFISDRDRLTVKDMSTGKVTKLTDDSTTPGRNGVITYSWSPDSKWIVLEVIDKHHDPYTDIAIIEVATGKMTNLTNTGYFDTNPRWALDGKAIIFETDRYGMRSHGSWGSLTDVMIVFLTQEAYDNYLLSEEDAEIAKDAEKKSDDSTDDKTVKVDFNGLDRRVVRLTPFSSEVASEIITADGETLLFITDGREDDNTLWKMNLRDGELQSSKSISSGLTAFEASADGKTIFILGTSMQKLTPSSLKLTPVTYSGQMKVDPAAEREYMFDFITREEQQRFYDVDMHGVDWPALTDHYRRFLPHINNNYDFAEMASEMLGELNVSHTGSGYRAPAGANNERTGKLGLLYDMAYTGKGLKIDEVLANGPFDNAKTRVRAGMIIEKINNEEITPAADASILLNDQAGRNTLVSVYDPASGERWDETVKPISAADMGELMYERWVRARAADVDRWSNGRLGYVHIESMNDASFRTIYSDLLGKYNDREGVVIDVRFNGGGRLHEDIEVLFSGQKYLTQVIRGTDVCAMPSRRWNKPSIMVTCEACYSNAHGTPWVYQHQGLGKVVGMPVPGTMTSVNWVTLQDPSLYFGIPVIGYRTAEGYYLENHQLTPDVIVANDPAALAAGEDAQLRRAVEELLRDLDSK